MSIGDIFKLTLIGQNGSTQLNNVFHYRQTFGVTGGDILAQEFINEVFPDIQNIVHESTVFSSVEWVNYNDLSDFGVDASIAGETGTRTGDALPRFNSWSFQYNRTTRETRNGSKRFSVVAEVDQNNGAALAAFLPTLETAAASLGQFINLGGTEIWRPVIARLNAQGNTVLLTNDVRDVTFKRLTTQNSRKGWT